MLTRIYMRLVQFLESWKWNGLISTFKEIIYLNRQAIPVQRDLLPLDPMMNNLTQSNTELIEISRHNFQNINLTYPLKNRYLKTLNNIKNGYRAIAIVRDNEVIGDVWYTTSKNPTRTSVHPDVKWLGIDFGEKDVYAWDMLIKPTERGNSISIYLMNGAMHILRKKGFEKLYGYYWADNIPALWMHRMLRFKELKRLKVHRFLYVKFIKQK